VENPNSLCSHGARISTAKNPYATDGMAARISITGFTKSLTLKETISLKKTAARIPTGTEKSRAANVTYSDPTIKARAPNFGLSASGYHSAPARNSVKLNPVRNRKASRITKMKINRTARTEVQVVRKTTVRPRCENKKPLTSCPGVSANGWRNPPAVGSSLRPKVRVFILISEKLFRNSPGLS